MNAAAGTQHRSSVENSPILAQTKCRTLRSAFRPPSLEALDGTTYDVTHNSPVKKTPQSGQR
jgi:hypothetical protein